MAKKLVKISEKNMENLLEHQKRTESPMNSIINEIIGSYYEARGK